MLKLVGKPVDHIRPEFPKMYTYSQTVQLNPSVPQVMNRTRSFCDFEICVAPRISMKTSSQILPRTPPHLLSSSHWVRIGTYSNQVTSRLKFSKLSFHRRSSSSLDQWASMTWETPRATLCSRKYLIIRMCGVTPDPAPNRK